MIDFACKEFDFDEVISCGFGLTKAEFNIFQKLINPPEEEKWFTTRELSKELNLNLSTVQRATKKFYEEKILERKQQNLERGGYIYVYKIVSKEELQKLLLEKISKWFRRVESEINHWQNKLIY